MFAYLSIQDLFYLWYYDDLGAYGLHSVATKLLDKAHKKIKL